jgi:Domain of unknown function (DUF397)
VPTAPQQTGQNWIKASRCYASSQCVEIAAAGNMIALRDTKNPTIHLYYSRAEMSAFLDGAKCGEFDHLIDPATGTRSE